MCAFEHICMKHEVSPECPFCFGVNEYADMCFFVAVLNTCETVVGQEIRLKPLVEDASIKSLFSTEVRIRKGRKELKSFLRKLMPSGRPVEKSQ